MKPFRLRRRSARAPRPSRLLLRRGAGDRAPPGPGPRRIQRRHPPRRAGRDRRAGRRRLHRHGRQLRHHPSRGDLRRQGELLRLQGDASAQGVQVVAGETTEVAVVLSLGTVELTEEITVTAEAGPAATSQAAALLERKKSGSVSDGLAREEMKTNADSDASEAMSRVTGVSVVGGQYVYVRGLGERYSNTTLNGSILPTTEPDKRVVPLDLFPTALLESVKVTKSYMPDKPAEFSGGLLEIEPINFPDGPVLSISFSGGYNSNTTGKDGLSLPGRRPRLAGLRRRSSGPARRHPEREGGPRRALRGRVQPSRSSRPSAAPSRTSGSRRRRPASPTPASPSSPATAGTSSARWAASPTTTRTASGPRSSSTTSSAPRQGRLHPDQRLRLPLLDVPGHRGRGGEPLLPLLGQPPPGLGELLHQQRPGRGPDLQRLPAGQGHPPRQRRASTGSRRRSSPASCRVSTSSPACRTAASTGAPPTPGPGGTSRTCGRTSTSSASSLGDFEWSDESQSGFRMFNDLTDNVYDGAVDWTMLFPGAAAPRVREGRWPVHPSHPRLPVPAPQVQAHRLPQRRPHPVAGGHLQCPRTSVPGRLPDLRGHPPHRQVRRHPRHLRRVRDGGPPDHLAPPLHRRRPGGELAAGGHHHRPLRPHHRGHPGQPGQHRRPARAEPRLPAQPRPEPPGRLQPDRQPPRVPGARALRVHRHRGRPGGGRQPRPAAGEDH